MNKWVKDFVKGRFCLVTCTYLRSVADPGILEPGTRSRSDIIFEVLIEIVLMLLCTYHPMFILVRVENETLHVDYNEVYARVMMSRFSKINL